jgi:hypothetical protein
MAKGETERLDINPRLPWCWLSSSKHGDLGRRMFAYGAAT